MANAAKRKRQPNPLRARLHFIRLQTFITLNALGKLAL